MKKEVIVCDKCRKEFEEATADYATVFIHNDGLINDRYDLCCYCWYKMRRTIDEKGGAE